MTLDVRVRRLSGTSAFRPEHLRCDSIDYSAALNETAALRLQLSQAEAVNGQVHDGEELALEIWDGSRWTEPEAARFSVLGRSLDELDPTRATATDVVEYVSFRLAGALLATQGGDRTYTDVTPGWMLDGILDEAQARGAAEGVTWTFTATHDSTGKPWASTLTMDLPADQPATETLAVLVAGGFIDWTTRGRELVVYARESAGVKRGFTIGKRALERPVRTSLAGVATDVILRLDSGQSIRKSGNAGLGLGVLERSISASGVTHQGTLDLLAAAELAGAAPKTELTVSETAATLDRVPLVHYDLGDWVLVRRSGAIEEVRVASVQLRRGTDMVLTVDIGLMDRLADTASKLAKRAKSLGNVGGNGKFKSGGGGGGASARYGTVDPTYLRGSGNPVYVDFGASSMEGPFDFLASYSPAGGDRVMVVDSTVAGRVTAEPGEVTGSVEILEPGPGWRNFDSARYGDLRVTKTASDWVILSGMLERDPNYTGDDAHVVAYVPGAYRPDRPMVYILAATEAGGTSHWPLTMDQESGALSFAPYYATNPASMPATVAMGSAVWTVATHDLWNVSNVTTGGVDRDGTVFLLGNSLRQDTVTFPQGLGPSRNHTYAGQRSSSLLTATVTPTSSWAGGTGTQRTYYRGYAMWPKVGEATYEFQQLTLRNGYTHHATEPLEYTKTPSGIVMLRGLNGGGGITNQSIATLPAGFRPSFEVVTHSGLRIMPSGAIHGLSTLAGQSTSNGQGYSTIASAFLAGR
ncbi:hypothetical protein AB2L57_10640 [Microbacterium sp. HA-8]|uniref:hypothetical protein n=1 Tax=Microbacterium sp. HA-8 TaxID=3234200 RepID=UPI0038F6F70B